MKLSGAQSFKGSRICATLALCLASLVWPLAAQSATGIQDAQGRDLLLRGINMRIQGIFDVSFEDGRLPLESIPKLDDEDLRLLPHLGFNVVRLPVNWSALEPRPDFYSMDYLYTLLHTLDQFSAAGVFVIVDMHQDAFSKETGEDGAPAWAVLPRIRSQNQGGALYDLMTMRISGQVQRAFSAFWRNANLRGRGIQDRYNDAVVYLWKSLHRHPAVLGIDIFNEPWLLHAKDLLPAEEAKDLSLSLLYDFYGRLIPRLQAVDSDKWIFFEPDIVKTTRGSLVGVPRIPYSAQEIPNPLPWNPSHTVYSPHLYTSASSVPGFPPDFARIRPGDPAVALHFANSRDEAKAFKAPLFLGEFGFQPKAKEYEATIQHILEIADTSLAHTALWLWKETSQDSWGFFDWNEVTGRYDLRTQAAKAVLRPYPQRISGELISTNADRQRAILKISFRYRDTGYPTVLFLPKELGFDESTKVLCDGHSLRPLKFQANGSMEVMCGQKSQVGNLVSLEIHGRPRS